MAALPWNFYMLTSLVELRMDANPGMKYPTPDTCDRGVSRCCCVFPSLLGLVSNTMWVVSFSIFDAPRRLLQGAEAVRNWFQKTKTSFVCEEASRRRDDAGLHGAM